MSYLIAGDGIGTWHVCCIMMTLMFLLWQNDSKTKIVSKLPMCHRSVDYELVVSKNYENSPTMKSNTRHTKLQNLNVSHLILLLSLPNGFKPGVKLIMKI